MLCLSLRIASASDVSSQTLHLGNNPILSIIRLSARLVAVVRVCGSTVCNKKLAAQHTPRHRIELRCNCALTAHTRNTAARESQVATASMQRALLATLLGGSHALAPVVQPRRHLTKLNSDMIKGSIVGEGRHHPAEVAPQDDDLADPPQTMAQCLQQAQDATVAAIEDGQILMDVEFPSTSSRPHGRTNTSCGRHGGREYKVSHKIRPGHPSPEPVRRWPSCTLTFLSLKEQWNSPVATRRSPACLCIV